MKILGKSVKCSTCDTPMTLYQTRKGYLSQCPNGCERVFHQNPNFSWCEHAKVVMNGKFKNKVGGWTMERCIFCKFTYFTYQPLKEGY